MTRHEFQTQALKDQKEGKRHREITSIGDGVFEGMLCGYNFCYNNRIYRSSVGIRSVIPVDYVLEIKDGKIINDYAKRRID